MKGNKYDNLFGDDRDWIEDALRDHDVPDGVINEIGAHFFVLQTKVDKLEAEKAGKRDIFAEIGQEMHDEKIHLKSGRDIFAEIANDYDGDADLNAYFTKIAKDDKPKNITPSVDEIMSLWPAGTEVKYNTFIEATRLKVAVSVIHDGALAMFTYFWKTAEPYNTGGQHGVHDWIGQLKHDQRVALKKKLLKNIQRTVDVAKARNPLKITKGKPHFQSLKTGPFFPITPRSIADLWPIGMSVEYTHRRTNTKRSFLRTSFNVLHITDYLIESDHHVNQGTRKLFPFLRELNHEKKRKLLKRVLKNRQRTRDSKR